MIKLNKILSLIILVLIVVSCGKNTTNNFTLNGTIKGLKKGVVYLQKEGDSTIVNLDSLVIQGQKEFTLSTQIDEPILLYLKLFKNDGEEHYIPFFADKGVTKIKTTLKNFNFDAKINGSKQQQKLDEYLNVIKSFNTQNLDQIEASFLAQKNNDSLTYKNLLKNSDKLYKRKYTYTIQFAYNNADNEVAPYLALYEIKNVNPKYRDSIYNRLTDDIKNSFYGKKLKDVITTKNSEN
ncbi:MAG: DUF4369 domain-containing protein [Winogradskyella sp.]